jgi:selT/selW/selH-like putative selenoprotein
VSAELREAFPEAEVVLIEGGRGIFDVIWDGEKVFSKYQEGRHAEPGEVVQTIQRKLGAA